MPGFHLVVLDGKVCETVKCEYVNSSSTANHISGLVLIVIKRYVKIVYVNSVFTAKGISGLVNC